MTAPAIRIEHLSKAYQVKRAAPRHTMFMDVFDDWIRRALRKRTTRLLDSSDETFWALRDVSFEIQPGEVVGIIGRNGAGKSTLLKVLSRITAPTEGRVTIRGRVASLLEVGTGFHHELTGRENVYMNGSILGMRRAEIDRKFDAIVDFSGVERFLDTPLKRYSSGMQVRLAFAVAAHLDPEILIVDEVLAVGDAEFQKRCLGRMQEVSRAGRTVLFVSHNLGAVRDLCSRGVLLEHGQLAMQGEVGAAIATYMSQGTDIDQRSWSDAERPGESGLKLCSVALARGEHIEIAIETIAQRPLREVNIGIVLSDAQGATVLQSASLLGSAPVARAAGAATLRCRFPAHLLNAGHYSVSVWGDSPNIAMYFFEHDILTFAVETTSSSLSRYPAGAWKGPINPLVADWTFEPIVEAVAGANE